MSIYHQRSWGVAAARGGVTHVLGKLDADFPKFRGPRETKQILERRAARLGMSLAEYLRELAVLHAHGADTLKALHNHRIEAVGRIGEETGE